MTATWWDQLRRRPRGPCWRELRCFAQAAGLQRGHGDGASPSKPSIRVTSSHWPHQGGRDGRGRCGSGSSAAESRAASTAYGLRTPAVFAPVKAASACGDQPASIATCTAGASLDRWSAVSAQPPPSSPKNSPAIWPPPVMPSVAGTWHAFMAAADGSVDGSLDVSGAATAPRGSAGCTLSPHWLHPAPCSGCNGCTPSGRLSTGSLLPEAGCDDCTRQGEHQRPAAQPQRA